MLPPSPSLRRARFAVATLFLVNGALFANVVPRLPDIKADLSLSNGALGLSVAAYPAGALIVGLLGGVLVGRYTSRRIAPLSAVAVAANLVVIGLAPNWATFSAAMFVAGSLDATADVANNAHGLRVEHGYRRSILNSLHALWSVGAVAGGVMGGVASGLGLPVDAHLAIAAALLCVVAGGVWRLLLPGPDEPPADPGADPARPRVARMLWAIPALGLVAAAAQLMEDAAANWSAIYLRQDLAAPVALGGAGFIALQGMQTLGRLLGDRAVNRFGDRAVARAGTALAGGAMAVALAVPHVVTTIVAFGAVGLGIGTLIPGALRTGNGVPGLRPGLGLSLVATIDRVVSVLAPPAIGVVADAQSLRAGLIAIPAAAVVALALSWSLPARPP